MSADFDVENGVLKKYYGSSTDIIIPDGVTEIGFSAFDNQAIEHVVIPNCVTDIGSCAFAGCKNLKTIEFRGEIKSIGVLTFNRCESLTEIDLPEGMTNIDEMFFGCNNLKRISFPSTMLNINDRLFEFCNWGNDGCLEEITVKEGNPVYFSDDGILYKKSDSGIELIKCPPKKQGTVKVKDGTTSINKDAFYRCIINEIILPLTVKTVGYRGLGCCCDRIVFSQNVSKISEEAFVGKTVYGSGIKEFVVDENNSFYISVDGVLFKKEENDKLSLLAFPANRTDKYVIPKGVERIFKYAFLGSALKELIIPKEISELPPTECLPINASVKYESGYAQTTEKIPAVYLDYVNIENATDCAYVALYQNGKKWTEKVTLYFGQDNENIGNTIREMINILDKEKNEKILVKAVDTVLTTLDTADHGLVKEFYDFIDKKQSKKALKLLNDNKKVQEILLECISGSPTEKNQNTNNPTEEEVKTLWKLTPAAKKLGEIISSGIRYKDSEELCSDQVLKYVISEYAEELDGEERFVSTFESNYVKTKFNKNADHIAESLNQADLQEVLEQLAFNDKYWKDGYLIPFARFASSRQIAKLITNMKNWVGKGPRGRAAIIIARGGLMLSDTREAMLAIDNSGGLAYYASLRDKDPDVLRDSLLSDFGFDSNGDKIYDLGANKVVVRLNTELKLDLYDGNTGKPVKSIPKKNANPDLYESAKTDLADLKKNIRKVYTNRKKLMFRAFLSGREFTPENWKKYYLGNPVLAAMTRLLVWDQENCYFTLRQGQTVDNNEREIFLDDKKQIRLAYPTEMSPGEIDGWQDYFVRNELKQPFAQIWEPLYKPEDIKEDRYKGCTIPILRFNNKDEHGIHMEGLHSYSEGFEVHLKDCSLDCEPSVWRFVFGQTDDAVYELKSFKVNAFSRYANHIIGLLDRWTIEDRIKKDDTGIISSLAGCTVVQIKQYINIAGQNNSTNCQAALLEYINQHFGSYDPLAEYLLEE